MPSLYCRQFVPGSMDIADAKVKLRWLLPKTVNNIKEQTTALQTMCVIVMGEKPCL